MNKGDAFAALAQRHQPKLTIEDSQIHINILTHSKMRQKEKRDRWNDKKDKQTRREEENNTKSKKENITFAEKRLRHRGIQTHTPLTFLQNS